MWCVRQGACRFWRGEIKKVGSSARNSSRGRFFLITKILSCEAVFGRLRFRNAGCSIYSHKCKILQPMSVTTAFCPLYTRLSHSARCYPPTADTSHSGSCMLSTWASSLREEECCEIDLPADYSCSLHMSHRFFAPPNLFLSPVPHTDITERCPVELHRGAIWPVRFPC